MNFPHRNWEMKTKSGSTRSPRPATVQAFSLLHLVRDFPTIVPLIVEFTNDENPPIVWLTQDDFAEVLAEEGRRYSPRERKFGDGILLTIVRDVDPDILEIRSVAYPDDSP